MSNHTPVVIQSPALDPSPQAEGEPDEADITASLARLQEMHIALRNLRETIPRVMDSVLIDPLAPEQLHLHFAQAAKAAASDIKSFAHIMEDPQNKDVLEKAKESRAKNAEDITNWLVTEHEDWLDSRIDAVGDSVILKDRDDEETRSASEMRVEDIQSILEKFRDSHEGIEATMDTDSKTIKIYLMPPVHIYFEVQPATTDHAQGSWTVTSKEQTKLHKGILAAVAARPRPDDLELLIELLTSYTDVKSKPCAKCSRLLDRNAQFPIRRSRKRTKQADGKYLEYWEALHPSCD